MNSLFLSGRILEDPAPYRHRAPNGTEKISFLIETATTHGRLIIEGLAFGSCAREIEPGWANLVGRFDVKENRREHRVKVLPDVIFLCNAVEQLEVQHDGEEQAVAP